MVAKRKFQKAYGILETCDDEAFTRIEAWDDAITALAQSILISASVQFEVDRDKLQSQAHQVLGQTYLEHYYSDESLVGVPESREDDIRKASL